MFMGFPRLMEAVHCVTAMIPLNRSKLAPGAMNARHTGATRNAVLTFPVPWGRVRPVSRRLRSRGSGLGGDLSGLTGKRAAEAAPTTTTAKNKKSPARAGLFMRHAIAYSR
jgi:hypothetical protein